ncbi:L-ribulose-5-phosphate 3-epimerase [Mangrovibacter phragmitis]|uniref:L-ribulose-5-phosphate 3-epimerase n=1 Tax=Mangrovibacter phragmitis TaxID=1691903 RepID=UPI003369D15A
MYSQEDNFRLGLYEKAMPAHLTWEEKIKAAKALGFDFIEMSIDESDERQARLVWDDSHIAWLRRLSEQYSLPIQSLCLSAHRRFPFGSTDPEVRDKAHQIMEQAITLACKLGIRCIQLAGYDVYYEPQSPETNQHFIAGMQAAAKMAERAGVMLGVEIMDTPYLNSLSKFEILKRHIPSPFFMAYPDVGNITGWNYDICTELKLSRQHIIQIHLKETRKVCGPGKGQFRDLVIGEGDVDFPSVFHTLSEIGFKGPLVLEMWAQDENWADNVALAKSRLEIMAQESGVSFA